jgi:hypothetical protein
MQALRDGFDRQGADFGELKVREDLVGDMHGLPKAPFSEAKDDQDMWGTAATVLENFGYDVGDFLDYLQERGLVTDHNADPIRQNSDDLLRA